MKVLIITQKVDANDDVLGFFHDWIRIFARDVEKAIVIAQFVGEHNLQKNVEVFSLGKENGRSKVYQLFRFYHLLFKNLSGIDAVFVHMIPMWIVLGCPFFKFYQKNVYLWHTHKSVNIWLKMAEKLVSKIFTASPESCRLKSKKIVVTGHGIDTDKFKVQGSKFKVQGEKFKIISVGRIAPVKNHEILVAAAEILKNKSRTFCSHKMLTQPQEVLGFSKKVRDKNFDFEIRIAGQPILENDRTYFEKLKNSIKEKNLEDKIVFVGAISNKDIAEFYGSGDLFVNLSDTGSIDKAVLEAMVSGLLVLTSNEAFKNILPEKYLVSKNPEEIAEKIIAFSQADSDPGLRECVVQNHSLGRLIAKLISIMSV